MGRQRLAWLDSYIAPEAPLKATVGGRTEDPVPAMGFGWQALATGAVVSKRAPVYRPWDMGRYRLAQLPHKPAR